jgi:uncharacterized membrane protein
MATIPTHAVIASFPTEDGASAALGTLKEAKKSQGLGVQNAAVLHMGDDRKLHIKETADMTTGKGVMVGGVVGGVIGLFGSAILLPLGIGAVAGGLAARLRDSGFPNQPLEELGARLQPGQSVLVIAVDEGAVQSVEQILKQAGSEVVREAVDGKVAEQLEATAAESEQPTSIEQLAGSMPPPPMEQPSAGNPPA